MRTFQYKGYGRIYLEHAEHIAIVREIIKEMDAFEYDYLPTDMIATMDEYPKLTYTHKFDTVDLDLLAAKCWMRSIPILVVCNGGSEFLHEIAKATEPTN